MKLGLISIGVGGTGGHNTLLSNIGNCLDDKHEIFIISEYDYSSNSNNSRIKNIKVSKQQHKQSLAGSLDHDSYSEIIDAINTYELDNILFSTFFDKRILDYANENNVKKTLVTYPLRDTFSEYFFQKKFQNLFDNFVVLDDLAGLIPYENNEKVSIAKYNSTVDSLNQKNKEIIIGCGGGGRPSASRYFELITELAPYLKEMSAEYKISISTGAYNSDFSKIEEALGNIAIVKPWFKNWTKMVKTAALVVSEAGYFSVQELISARTPGLLIPGERRMDNQELRAITYESKGLGKCVLPQEDSTSLKLAIEELIDSVNSQKVNIACETYSSSIKSKDLGEYMNELMVLKQ